MAIEKVTKVKTMTSNLDNMQMNSTIMRMRRLRKNQAIRNLLRENTVTKDDFIYPIFVEEECNERMEIKSLPGVFRETEKTLPARMEEVSKSGINAVILFGVSKHKDHYGSDSLKADGLLSRMIKIAKDAAPEILVMADICLCEYTDHGHCGPIGKDGAPDNDRTLDIISKQAVIAGEAGADIIAPSGMMDGMVAAIRTELDQNGLQDHPVLSYAAKFASAHYGPFRDAAGCSLGSENMAQSDRKTYQMNPANINEALREVSIDIDEGADMVMVKPGLPYLDVIKEVKETFKLPTFAYHVSGEYAMLHAAAANGWIDYEQALMEQMMAFKRAGADGIITYASLDALKLL